MSLRLVEQHGVPIFQSIEKAGSIRARWQQNWETPGRRALGFRSSGTIPSRQDRYYAAHLLGDLKDPRAIPIQVPFLADTGINHIVPWSLAQIGDRSAIAPLIATLSNRSPSMRVLAVKALAALKATEAVPRPRLLLNDPEKCNFDKLESIAETAKEAITARQPKPAR